MGGGQLRARGAALVDQPEGARPRGARWWFDAPYGRAVVVAGVPRPDAATSRFAAVAVPQIAAAGFGPVATPCVVVARLTAAAAPSRPAPGGPRGRAKALLDVLHDDRQAGPHYADLGLAPPLPDDDVAHVAGLAVEVRVGSRERVEYRIGPDLSVGGRLLAGVDVNESAPNDIAATPADKIKIDAARTRFGQSLVASWRRAAPAVRRAEARAVVVRHRPGRDEDNTWATWVGALLGTARWSAPLWGGAVPLAGWQPVAIASVSDPDLPCEVRYEVWGAA